ncbi:MAG: MarR family transcriptional regulator [Sphingomonadales bacterium]|nr:MAG: MarR family transcriptional regulator [Sphingomonadales bacterium]
MQCHQSRMAKNVTLLIPLFEAFSWFETGVQTMMDEAGWAPVSRQQVLVLILIRQGCDRPAAIARALGITRQATSVIIADMVEQGILSLIADPRDKRAKTVLITSKGQKRADDAREAMLVLTDELSRRIGADNVDKLWTALSAFWGPPIENAADLRART